MMGSATELPKAPEKKTVFIEDMTDAERATAVSFCLYFQSTIYLTYQDNLEYFIIVKFIAS